MCFPGYALGTHIQHGKICGTTPLKAWLFPPRDHIFKEYHQNIQKKRFLEKKSSTALFSFTEFYLTPMTSNEPKSSPDDPR